MKKAVVVKGVPWDEKSSFLRGCAAAPGLIRRAFHSPAVNTCVEDGRELGREERFSFAGDMDLSSGRSVPEEIETQASALFSAGAAPLFLGGDHAVTFPLVKAAAAVFGPVSVLHFDAHPDLYDALEGDRLSHACPFARLWEAGAIKNHLAVGLRTVNSHQREQAAKFGSVMREMTAFPWPPLPRFDGPVYLSVDLDALDPAFAPGVSHLEPGGLSTRDLVRMVQDLDADLVGADIVEFNPVRDPNGLTAAVAAKLLKEIAARLLSR